MNDEKASSEVPSLDKSDPTNAKLATLIIGRTQKVLDSLANLEERLTPKGEVALALANVFATMLPDGEPMTEIPEGWAPVALAINPATGEFLTIAGPRSGPDGRVEAVETMLARQMQNSVAGAIGAVREAGRPQPKPRNEARPQPKPGEPDYEDESERE